MLEQAHEKAESLTALSCTLPVALIIPMIFITREGDLFGVGPILPYDELVVRYRRLRFLYK